MKKVALVLVLLAGTLLGTQTAGAAVAGFRGAVVLGPRFGYGPWGYSRWGYGAWGYGPWGYGPWGYGPPVVMAHPHGGQLKIETKVKDAEVFLNGSYAGMTKDMKSTWLRQGSYDLEIKDKSGDRFAERIYIVDGKTLKVHPDLKEGPQS